MTIIAAVASLAGGAAESAAAAHVPHRRRRGDGQSEFPEISRVAQRPAQDGGFRFSLRHRAAESRPVVITCGLRGLALLDVHVTGAKGDLHSGLHGLACCAIRSRHSLKSSRRCTHPEGRVNVPGFYDDRAGCRTVGARGVKKLGADDEKAYKEFLGIDTFYTTPGFTPFEALRFQPTLEFNGIGGGYQGRGRRPSFRARPSRRSVAGSCPNQRPRQNTKLGARHDSLARTKGVKIEFVDQHKGDPTSSCRRVAPTRRKISHRYWRKVSRHGCRGEGSVGTPAALFARRRQRADHRRHQAPGPDSIP